MSLNWKWLQSRTQNAQESYTGFCSVSFTCTRIIINAYCFCWREKERKSSYWFTICLCWKILYDICNNKDMYISCSLYYWIYQKIIYKYVISFLNMVHSISSWTILVERRHISWVYEQTKECIILYDSCKDKITSWLILLSDS